MAEISVSDREHLISQLATFNMTPAMAGIVVGIVAILAPTLLHDFPIFELVFASGIYPKILSAVVGVFLVGFSVWKIRESMSVIRHLTAVLASVEPRTISVTIIPPDLGQPDSFYKAILRPEKIEVDLFFPRDDINEIVNRDIELPVYFDLRDSRPVAISTACGFLFVRP